MNSSNPFEIALNNVTIEKFDGSDRISILPQFTEINIFQSVFSPLMRATLMVYDPIGMFVNYPLSGEEIIRMDLSQQRSGRIIKSSSTGFPLAFPFNNPLRQGEFDTGPSSVKLNFMIASITDITPMDRARASVYLLNLVSPEMFEASIVNVSQFCPGPFDRDAEDLWKEYVIKPFQEKERQRGSVVERGGNAFKKFYRDNDILGKARESTEGLVIPNINPIKALNILGKFSIAEQTPEVYCNNVFFENFYGYFFTTIQSLIQDQLQYGDQMVEREKYLYTSNIETLKVKMQDEAAIEDQMNRMISNISINNRYLTLDKIMGGYYTSELYEVNPNQKRYMSTISKLSESDMSGYLHEGNKFNTEAFIEESEKNLLSETLTEEIASHIKYEITLATDNEYDFRRLKYNAATKYLHALNSIDLTITVPPDLSHNCGEVIYCEIPEMHGFETIQEDRYLSGFFFVTEVKHIITTGGRASTTMRIQKDSLQNKLGGFKYSLSSDDNRMITNTTTGEIE